MTDLVPQNNTLSQNKSFFEMKPQEMVEEATNLANVLKDVIDRQNLAIDIKGKHYVKVEGWATMGSMMGIVPREKSVIEHKDGSFEAVVELYSIKTGSIVGQGSAICGMDEQRWRTANRFSRRSMAITRATGKAYRLGFAWVMCLAGYETTPEEEMAHVIEAEVKKPTSQDPFAGL